MSEDIKKVILESGIEVKPVYGPDDIAAGDPTGSIGQPGEYPFTRGIHKLMYRKRPFTMRQYSGFASASQTNQRFRFLIEQGQTGLNVAFDLPTQMGLDSDDDRSFGEVGRVGMAVDSLADMETAFEGIPLDKITVSLTINAVAVVLMAMYFAMAEKQGYDLKSLRGTAQNDILKEYVGRGTWIFPVEPSMRLIGDTIEFCAREVPKYSPVSVCGYHIRESGADPVQEMAYAFGIARAYADEALNRGLDIDEFAGRLSFNFDIFGSLFEQVAKFRAGRRYWARIIKEDYGAKDPRSLWLRMIAGGGGGGLTIQQPENNIVRGAYYALISALSGTQTMALCSYDEAYTIPSEKAALISLRTMQILIEEMGLADTVDPLGGSYYVESLTDEMEKLIEECLNDVLDRGGMVKLIADGTIQQQVAKQAYQTEKKIQSGEIHKVGVNCYQTEDEERKVELHPYDEDAAEKQRERIRQIRQNRSQSDVDRCLSEVRHIAEDGGNLMPPIIEAVKTYVTLGEITDVLKETFGEFNEPVRF
ncbi:methylmalonyl-CoA mutase [candidate division LCP-89 bacterium B3_LCP]|uniref:Methylmalonyl-CoA mutase n=1 Tax=candidate division LCP-89 bacterium B3_LCP TaxID=2012998 RepID=A0A532UUG8_UNCL8|nr:MAG: methylmalonyl-CoA mutase [candidate division LCP-89 bacterium B3_LCP]